MGALLIMALPISAIAPAILILVYFHRRDVYPEPPGVLWRTFGYGVLSVIPVLVAAWPINAAVGELADPWARSAFDAFIIAALLEEASKMGVLYWYSMRNDAFDEPMDGLVYGVAVAMGFAAIENVLYVSSGGFQLAVMRALTAVPMHAACGAIMGYHLALSRYLPRKRGRVLFAALAVPVLVHGVYDFPLMRLGEAPALEGAINIVLVAVPILTLTAGVAVAILLKKRVRQAQLEGVHEQMAQPNFSHFEQFHDRPVHHAASSWLRLFLGGGLLWLAVLGIVLGVVLAVQGEFLATALSVGVSLAVPGMLGRRLFRTGINRLNAEDLSAGAR
jgi:RsiW-degrading membrane proteinase PrsW (M82 family)